MSVIAESKPPFSEAQGLRKHYLSQEKALNYDHLRPGYTVTDANAVTKPGPDIEWIPSYETYRNRMSRLAAERVIPLKTQVPDNFPAKVNGDRVWDGQQLSLHDIVVNLDEKEVKEIVEALQTFTSAFPDTDPNDVSTSTFPLPTLGVKLGKMSEEIHFGRGLVILRGLNPQSFTSIENVLLYVGICRHIGSHFGIQDADGSYMIHIKDIGKEVPGSEFRQAPFASTAQPFHSDSSDILAMYALGKASQGGASLFASTGHIYNEIAKSRPDVIHTLAANNWIMDKHDNRGRPAYWYKRPLLFNFPDHGPGLYFNRRVLTGSAVSPRSRGVPPLTEEQAEALDMVHFTAEQSQLKVHLEPGDMVFVNNFAVLHARQDYQDGDDEAERNPAQPSSGMKRHLLRLWLRNTTHAWETPLALAASWLDTYGNSSRRAKAKWDIEVPLEKGRIIARANSCS